MIKIKFSHRYVKFPEAVEKRKTFLVGVSDCLLERMPLDFIFWDTLFINPDGSIGHYPLPEKGRFILQTLCTPDAIVDGKALPFELWTTIRRWTPRKMEYYSLHVGEQVAIEIMEACKQ